MGSYGGAVGDAFYGGFLHGQQLGEQRNQQQFLSTADQLFKNRDALQGKLSTLKDADGNPLPGYDDTMKALTDNETAIRQHWHPDKNPGMLQKFGHMITDRMGITDPNMRTIQADNKAVTQMQGDKNSAQALANAAPLSPAQVAMQNVATQGKVQAAQMQQVMTNFDQMNPDATPSQRAQFKKEYMESAFLGRRWSPLMDRGKTQLMVGEDAKGNPVQFMHDIYWNRNTDVAGNDIDEDVITGLKNVRPVPTTSSKQPSLGSAFQIALRAYAKSHGVADVSELPFSAVQYVNGVMAQSRLYPTSTTSHTMKLGPDNLWYPVQETNVKTPGGKLKDPLGGASSNWMNEASTAAPTPPQDGSTASPTVPASGASPTSNPQDLRREAEKRKPIAPTSYSAPAATGNLGVVVGQPLLQGKSPASDAANKKLNEAQAAYEEVVRAAHNTNPVDSQGIILSWLRGKVNRVTATEIAAVRNLGGVFDKFDGSLSSIEHGTMTPKQISWFVKNAKDNLDIARHVVSQYRNPVQGAQGAPAPGASDSGGGDWRSRAIPH